MKLPAGKHEIVLINGALKIKQSRSVQIAPNAQTKLILDLQRK